MKAFHSNGEPAMSGAVEDVVVQKTSMPAKRYYAVMLAVAVISTWIRMGFPTYAISEASYDDQLFIRTAHYLAAGQWLGPYDSLTLAKGMFYPLFIALAFWASIPLKIAEHCVYLAACALTARVVRKQSGNDSLSLVLFVLLSFNPVFWNIHLARVIREGLYISLSLFVVVLIVMIAFPASPQESRSSRRLVLLGLGLGLMAVAFWLTREEGMWLLPAAAAVLIIALLDRLLPSWRLASGRQSVPRGSAQVKAVALPLSLALVIFVAGDWLVAGLNFRHYGIFETNELKSKSFRHAYGALSRIQHDEWHRYIPFPKDARLRAYAVSPAARELANSLEGATGNLWLQGSCKLLNTKPCDEVQSAWEIWEFRNAVADAGHYHSGKDAKKFYDTLAEQIDSACDHRTIRCLPRRASLAPPFRWEYLGEAVSAGRLVAKGMFKMGDGRVGSAASSGSAEEIAIFADMVGSVYLPEARTSSVRGWVAAASGTPTMRLVTHTQEHVESSLDILPAPDVLAVYPQLKAIRFELRTDSPVASSELVVDAPGVGQFSIPFAQLVHGPAISIPGLWVQVDSASVGEGTKATNTRRAVQVKIATVIASSYAIAFPVLIVFGAAGLLIATFFRQLCPIPAGLLALGLGSAAAVGSRIALLAYLYASSFSIMPADVLYSSPASSFVIILTVIGIYSCYVTLKGGHRRYLRRSSWSSESYSSDHVASRGVGVKGLRLFL
jgi:hypothetical protein